MGNPRKPTQLKAICGTERKDREVPADLGVDLPVLEEIPACPDWMPNSHAIVEWNRIAPVLFRNRLLNEANVSSLGHLCALHGKIVQLWAAGETPNASLVQQYRGLVGEFGLTPVSSARVKAQGEAPAQNKFTKHIPKR